MIRLQDENFQDRLSVSAFSTRANVSRIRTSEELPLAIHLRSDTASAFKMVAHNYATTFAIDTSSK